MATEAQVPSSEAPPLNIELGTSGLRHSNGFLDEEFDPQLRGARGAEKFREMRDNSPAVGASLHAFEIIIRGTETEIVPFSGDREDEERAEFVDSCLHDMSFSWPSTRAEHLTMIPFGYALCEIVYKRREGFKDRGVENSKHDDGRIGWAKIPLRGQETIEQWKLDENGGIQGAWQVAPPDYRRRFMPIQKALLFRTTEERNNPEGRSRLRCAYWPWFASKRLTETALIGVQRDLAGLPVVRGPKEIFDADATPEQKNVFAKLKEIGVNVHRGDQEVVVLPSSLSEGGQHYYYDISLLNAGGQRQFDIPKMVSMFDRWIATVLLTDLLLMGHEAVGSFALAKGKVGILDKAIDGYLSIIDEVYNQHAIPKLMRINGWPANRCPRLKHKPLSPEDLAALGDFLSKISTAGVLEPDDRLEDHLRKEARLPPKVVGPTGRPARDPETQPA